MKQAEIIEQFIINIANDNDINISEIHIRIHPLGFLSVWRYIETGIDKNDKWELIECKKINNW